MTEMTRLDRVASVQARIGWKALTAAEYLDEGYAFLATPNIKGANIDFENVNYISKFRFEESPELKLAVGDVLLAKDGNTLGITNCVRALPKPATVNGSIAVIRPRSIDSIFLTYWLASKSIQALIEQVKDGMGVPHLFQKDIRKFPIPALRIEEQRRIADFLDDRVSRIDRIIAARRDQETSLRAWHDATIRGITESAGDTTRPTGVPWHPIIAEGWQYPRVAQVFATGSGTTPPSDNRGYYGGTIPWVTTGDIQDAALVTTSKTVSERALSDFSTLVQYPPGTLLVAMYGQGKTKGRVAMLEVQACVNQACCAIQGPRLLTEWAFFWFRAHKLAIIELANGAGQPNLSQDTIRSIRVPLPGESQRQQLLSRLRELDENVAVALRSGESQMRLLTEYKTSLITAAVTGDLDVTTAGSNIPG